MQVKYSITAEIAGESGVILYLPLPVCPTYPLLLQNLSDYLHVKLAGSLRELVPAYRSLLVEYDNQQVDYQRIVTLVKAWLEFPSKQKNGKDNSAKLHKIPVCYNTTYGLDLLNIAVKTKLAIDDIITIHSSTIYDVYGIGFIPAFPFLGNVDERIALPRHSEPRQRVPSGSVAITGNQSGIYPIETPGGWQIIGRTPLKLYRPQQNQFSPFTIGDQVQFYAISQSQFLTIQQNEQ